MLRGVRTFSSTTRNSVFNVKLTPNKKVSLDFNQDTNKFNQTKPTSQNQIKKLEPRLIKTFQSGSIYDPFDFSLPKIHLDRKLSSKLSTKNDLFEKYGINPLDMYTRPDILSEYVSQTGRILHRDVTGLSAKNQRRLSKAIRRAQAIGLISKVTRDVMALPSRSTRN